MLPALPLHANGNSLFRAFRRARRLMISKKWQFKSTLTSCRVLSQYAFGLMEVAQGEKQPRSLNKACRGAQKALENQQLTSQVDSTDLLPSLTVYHSHICPRLSDRLGVPKNEVLAVTVRFGSLRATQLLWPQKASLQGICCKPQLQYLCRSWQIWLPLSLPWETSYPRILCQQLHSHWPNQ